MTSLARSFEGLRNPLGYKFYKGSFGMKISLTCSEDPGFLRITAAGEYVFSDIPDFIRRDREEARQRNHTRVLIDCRSVTGAITESERFMSGQWVAEVFRRPLEAALPMESRKITKLGALTAINRGADFLVTNSSDEAVNWLLAGAKAAT
jgi:hypothetical protein